MPGPPEVTISPSVRTSFSLGGTIRIDCRATGLPTPTLEWLKGSTYLFDIGKIRFVKKYIYIFSIALRPAVLGFVPLLAANREYSAWLKDRILKPARKLLLVVTFVPSKSARPDQIADLIKELYIAAVF